MKVTKLIREYVEEQVSKAYAARKNPYSDMAKLDNEKLEDYQKLLHKQQREFLDAIQRELPLFNRWNNEPVDHISTNCPCLASYKTFAMRQAGEWDRENKQLKNAKIREILLNLELGATRKELDEMLAKVLEEV